ncbi:IGR protein motif-domain-containing protein [Radiomyces spectabilis]|uniref:IGR protein motif-domain-containing protein n=1 Tax=Radiomyces spectabilis TaxID=64574 RepID=UPI00221FCB9F|nr:IGR protein motif-domain-containing protein [Radiomyces spectabilis]KAI8388518.1 IGR protein motif-domain-containing protein [Radiomyces spectabilis]
MLASLRSSVLGQARRLHTATGRTAVVPEPRGKIQDAESFLKSIGRGCDEYASKFESWEQLFTTDSRTMKNDMGISTKQRKYLLAWLEQYRQGRDTYPISLPSPKKKK